MKIRPVISLLLVLALMLSLSGCAAESCGTLEGGTSITPEKATKADRAAMAESVNRFGWKLYKESAGEDNLFYSPLSLEAALAMCIPAARGDTRNELKEVLELPDYASFARAMAWLRGAYSEPEEEAAGKLTVANSLWLEKTLELAENAGSEVADPLKAYFGADIKTADFKQNAEAVQKDIAEWVKEHTNGMIPDYKSISNQMTRADLINAIYFYGEWALPFEAEDTREQSFYGTGGETTVDMMSQGNVFLPYLETDSGLRVLGFPYVRNGFEMDLIIGEPGEDIAAAVKKENLPELLTALDGQEDTRIETLQMPKFTIDVTYPELVEALKGVGMKRAFSDAADFSNLAKNLMISDVNHRAKLEVDELGSKAAAVTEVVMVEGAMILPEEPAPEFIVDRPFFFVIRECDTGMILFAGHVNNLKK